MATREEREQAFIRQRAAELRAQGKPVDRAKLAERFDTLAETKEGRQTITAAVQRAAAPAGSASAATPTQEEIDAEIARQDAFEDARSVESGGPSGLTYGGTEIGGGVVPPPVPATPVTDPVSTPDPFSAAQAVLDQQRTDAFSTLRALLNRVGLGELESAVQGVITSGRVSLTDPSAIMFALRDQPAYQKRFAANKKRIENGFPELDPSTYVAMEEQYRQTLAANGLPSNFYNDQTDFEKFIEGNVSINELQSRISDGYSKVANADPAVVAKLRELYDIGGGDLAAYFIDPQRVRPLLVASDYKRQAQAAAIAARGGEVGVELGREAAEGLARRGVTEQEAESRFSERGQLAGLFEEMTGEQGMSEEEKLGATFGYDVGAANRLKKRAATRRSVFQGGGGFARTSGATSGTIETGLSESQ